MAKATRLNAKTGEVTQVDFTPPPKTLEQARQEKLTALQAAYEVKRAEGFNGVPFNENMEKIVTGAAASLSAKARGEAQGKLGSRMAGKMGMTEAEFTGFADSYGDYAVALWMHRDAKIDEINAAESVEAAEAIDLTDWPTPA